MLALSRGGIRSQRRKTASAFRDSSAATTCGCAAAHEQPHAQYLAAAIARRRLPRGTQYASAPLRWALPFAAEPLAAALWATEESPGAVNGRGLGGGLRRFARALGRPPRRGCVGQAQMPRWLTAGSSGARSDRFQAP